MKKLSVILGVLAITLATIGTYAGNRKSAFVDGWEIVGATCKIESNRCTDNSSPLCTSSSTGNPLRANPTGNCGPQLNMP
jgi:hypothetical protein